VGWGGVEAGAALFAKSRAGPDRRLAGGTGQLKSAPALFAKGRIGRVVTAAVGAVHLRPQLFEQLLNKTHTQWKVIESRQSLILLTCNDTATFPSMWFYLGLCQLRQCEACVEPAVNLASIARDSSQRQRIESSRAKLEVARSCHDLAYCCRYQ
jgi:hypothetical protein